MQELSLGFIGLGLIGGSIAKSLRKALPHVRITAYNRSRESLVLAMQDGTVDHACDKVDASFSDCDVIFLCMPVSRNIELLPVLKEIVRPGCIITDVGSVKSGIQTEASRLGMEGCFIGGHPMAGSEKTGYGSSSTLLLENAYYIITPTDKTSPERISFMKDLVAKTGAIPIVLNPEKHDRATASISHLPHVIAYSLVNFVREADGDDGIMRALAAGGFKDITRIASSSPDMWESICLENKEQLLHAIEKYRETLDSAYNAIEKGDGAFLHEFFSAAKDYRDDMPTAGKGAGIAPVYEVYLDIADESGAIANVAVILAINNISIRNIAIIHNREFEDGVLRVEFYEEANVEKALEILEKFGYTVHRRN